MNLSSDMHISKGIYGISRDRSIQLLDTETGKAIKVRETTHEYVRVLLLIGRLDTDSCAFACRSPINSLLVIDEIMMASGDDQGVIKASH